jgi:hypothetical protein
MTPRRRGAPSPVPWEVPPRAWVASIAASKAMLRVRRARRPGPARRTTTAAVTWTLNCGRAPTSLPSAVGRPPNTGVGGGRETVVEKRKGGWMRTGGVGCRSGMGGYRDRERQRGRVRGSSRGGRSRAEIGPRRPGEAESTPRRHAARVDRQARWSRSEIGAMTSRPARWRSRARRRAPVRRRSHASPASTERTTGPCYSSPYSTWTSRSGHQPLLGAVLTRGAPPTGRCRRRRKAVPPLWYCQSSIHTDQITGRTTRLCPPRFAVLPGAQRGMG